MSARITVSLVTYNSAGIIGDCLKSIPEDCVVMIFDNASKDDTIAVAKAARPSVQVFTLGKNIGFGAGHNQILNRVETEFCLVLNPDTRILPGCFDHLLAAADHYKNAAIIGGQHYADDGETKLVCIGTDPYCHVQLERKKQNTKHQKKFPESICCVEFIIGALMLFRMSVFKETGFFDERVFMYHEDVEICARVRRAGYSVIYEPLAKVVHLSGQSSAPSYFVTRLKQYHHSQCKLIVYKKYHGAGATFATFAAKEFSMQLRRLLKAAIKGDCLKMHQHSAGIWGVVTGLRK